MYKKYVYSGTTWFDIVSADTSELLEIAQLYKLPDSVVKTIANNHGPSSFTTAEDCSVISLNFPAPTTLPDGSLSVSPQQISFILGKNFVITSRFSDVRGFKQIKREFKRYSIAKDEFPVFFLNLVLVFLYQSISSEVLISIPKKTAKLNETMSKDYLENYKKILEEHNDVFEKMQKNAQTPLVSESSLQVSREMLQNLLRVIERQHTVCIDCVGKKPSRIQTVLRYFR